MSHLKVSSVPRTGGGSSSAKAKGKEKGRSQRHRTKHDADAQPAYIPDYDSNGYPYKHGVLSYDESEEAQGDPTQQFQENGWYNSGYGYQPEGATYYGQPQEASTNDADVSSVELGSTAPSWTQSHSRGKQTAYPRGTATYTTQEMLYAHNNPESTYPSNHHYSPESEQQAYGGLKQQWREHGDVEQHSTTDMGVLTSGMKGVRLGRYPDDPQGPSYSEGHEFEDGQTLEVEGVTIPQMYYPDDNDEEHLDDGQTAGDSWLDDNHWLSMSETGPPVTHSDYFAYLRSEKTGMEARARALYDTGNKFSHLVSLSFIRRLGFDRKNLDGKPRLFYTVGSGSPSKTLGGLKMGYSSSDDGYFSTVTFQVMEVLLKGYPYDVIICPEGGIQGGSTPFVAAMVLPRKKETPEEKALREKAEKEQERLVAQQKAERAAAREAERARRKAEKKR